VMDKGLLQQYGTPAEVYNHPANTFVANFMGSPPMNLVACRIGERAGSLALDLGAAGQVAIGDPHLLQAAKTAKSRDVILGVRPETVELSHEPASEGFTFDVDLLEPIGPRTIIHLRADTLELLAVRDKRFGTSESGRVTAVFPQDKCHLFDPESGQVLGQRQMQEAA